MPTDTCGAFLLYFDVFWRIALFHYFRFMFGLAVVIQLFTELEILLTFLPFLTDLSHLEESKTDLVCVCSAPTITTSVMLFGH